MEYIIFYSWQSDHENATNRSFIETALERAAKAIRKDDSIQVEPVIDRDTSGVPGSPDIARTIFEKIEQCQVFVGDVSIINNAADAKRLTPNPNVLIELGYAMKVLGDRKVILVMNRAYGDPGLLPFDLKFRRVLGYEMAPETEDRGPERQKLQKLFESALRAIIDEDEPQQQPIGVDTAVSTTIGVITAQRPDAASSTRSTMNLLLDELDKIAPKFSGTPDDDEKLVESLDQSTEIMVKFAQVAQTIAQMNAADAALAFYKSLERVCNYNHPIGVVGRRLDTDFDFYKFINHELFVILISCLIQESRWGIITDVLNEGLYIQYRPGGPLETVSFYYLSQKVRLLDEIRDRRLNLNRTSVHADLLYERHSEGPLAEIVPAQQFMEADLLLYLRRNSHRWYPPSVLYIAHSPRYLAEAKLKKRAEELLSPLNVETIEQLRENLQQGLGDLVKWRGPLWGRGKFTETDITDIGSQS